MKAGGEGAAHVAALILAAGASRRMGEPKQLLPFRGRPLLRIAVEAALTAGAKPVVVVLGATRDRIAPVLADLPVAVAANRDWHQGLASSLRCGLDALAPHDPAATLICVGDQPFADAEHLRALITAWSGAADALVASRYDGVLGVPALVGSAHFETLRHMKGDRGARALFEREANRVVAVPFEAGSVDIDTPADYAALTGSSAPRHGMGNR